MKRWKIMNKESEKFREYAHQFVDWIADYMNNVEHYPVKSQVGPKEVYNQIDKSIPNEGDKIEEIFKDFKEIIIPGVTHWQSPNFFAYFQANTSLRPFWLRCSQLLLAFRA